MNKPMILPWLAKKWGVSEDRASVLWDKACRSAAREIGNDRSSDYFAMSIKKMMDLLEVEALMNVLPAAMPWVMIQMNVLRVMTYAKVYLQSMERRLGMIIAH